MGKYNFDAEIDRRNTHSIKWSYAKERAGEEDALPMWVADMDFETVPEVRDVIAARMKHNLYGYSAIPDSYYRALIGWNEKRHGWKIEREWIVHSVNVVNGMSLAIHALTEPGDGIVVQPPVYTPFYNTVNSAGRRLLLNPLHIVDGRYTFDFDDLERIFKTEHPKLFMLCNPHNPVGTVFTRAELAELGRLALQYGVLLFSDEIHSDLVYRQYRHTPVASISEELAQITITGTSPSKTFNLAGVSFANIIIPNPTLRKKFSAWLQRLAIGIDNVLGAEAVEAAYTYGEPWLEELLGYLEVNKQRVRQYMRNQTYGLKTNDPQGTFFLWMDFRALGLDNIQLEEFLLHRAKVWFNQGNGYGAGSDGLVRANIACTHSTLEEALRRLDNTVHGL